LRYLTDNTVTELLFYVVLNTSLTVRNVELTAQFFRTVSSFIWLSEQWFYWMILK